MLKTSFMDIEQWLKQLASKTNSQACKIHSNFIKPYQLLTLAFQLKKKNIKDFDISEDIKSYVARMEVWKVANPQLPFDITCNNAKGKFLPITAIKSADSVYESAKNLTDIAIDNNAFLEDQKGDIFSVLFELLDNCYSHSENTSLYGLACAQNWAQGNQIQVAIVDEGIGIRASLSCNPDLTDLIKDNNACEIASRFGITSKPSKGHAGYGLALARDLTRLNNGNFVLISENEGFRECEGKQAFFNLQHSWKGTILIIEWNVNNIINTRQVYDNWPLPKGFNDDDFDI